MDPPAHSAHSPALGPLARKEILSSGGGFVDTSPHSYKLHSMTHFFQIILDVAFSFDILILYHLLEDPACLLNQSITSPILAKDIHIGSKVLCLRTDLEYQGNCYAELCITHSIPDPH